MANVVQQKGKNHNVLTRKSVTRTGFWESTRTSSRNIFLTKLKASDLSRNRRYRNTFLTKVINNVQTSFRSRDSRQNTVNVKYETPGKLSYGKDFKDSPTVDDTTCEVRDIPNVICEDRNVDSPNEESKDDDISNDKDVNDILPACTSGCTPDSISRDRRERFGRRRSVSAMSFLPNLLPKSPSCSETSDDDVTSVDTHSSSSTTRHRITSDRSLKVKDFSYWKGVRENYVHKTKSHTFSPRTGTPKSQTRNARRLHYGTSYQTFPSSSLTSKTQSGFVEDRKSQRSLRKVCSSANFREKRSTQLYAPLVRFRRVVRTVMLLLKATVSSRKWQYFIVPRFRRLMRVDWQNKQRQERRMLSWTQVHDDIGTSRRAYERFGLTFDPSEFKVKRETQIKAEVKSILSLDPEDRTPEQLHLVLLGLISAVDVFGEFPIKMQQSLVRVGWYERFEAKRVIIRQGHTADNFYFILSGTAVVTILETDPVTKEQYANTVALLKKGNSFGELALMHGARRSATVTCKDDVELLAVGRDDFVDIFMHVEKNREPDHIRFLHSIDVLQGWPVHVLPYHDPNICLFTYFRRGVLLCKDSNRADWIYVIKTGACRVLKSLNVARPKVKTKKKTTKRKLPSQQHQITSILSVKEKSSVSEAWTSDCKVKPSRRNLQVTFSLPSLQSKQTEWQQSAEKHMKQLDEILEKHNSTQSGNISVQTEEGETDENTQQIFVEVQKMGPRDIFGLEQAVFSLIRCTTSTSLVSDGAECILINRKFFLRHLSEDTAKAIRKMIQPLPTEEALRHKLENKASWEAFKTSTLLEHLVYRKHLHDYMNF